jgi:hypothetical protein
MGVSTEKTNCIHNTRDTTSSITGCVSESGNRTFHLAEEGDVRPGPQCSTETHDESVSKKKLQTLRNMVLEVWGDTQKLQQQLFTEKNTWELQSLYEEDCRSCSHRIMETGTRCKT